MIKYRTLNHIRGKSLSFSETQELTWPNYFGKAMKGKISDCKSNKKPEFARNGFLGRQKLCQRMKMNVVEQALTHPCHKRRRCLSGIIFY